MKAIYDVDVGAVVRKVTQHTGENTPRLCVLGAGVQCIGFALFIGLAGLGVQPTLAVQACCMLCRVGNASGCRRGALVGGGGGGMDLLPAGPHTDAQHDQG